MCLTIDPSSRRKIADKDIECFKVLVYYENHDLNKKYRTPYHLYVIRKGATYDSNLIKVMNNEVREGLHTFASIKEAKLELRE
jgi:hypothetical protein